MREVSVKIKIVNMWKVFCVITFFICIILHGSTILGKTEKINFLVNEILNFSLNLFIR